MENNENQSEKKVYSRFTTEMTVRPDDIDLFQHVHSSRYMDYLLAARFDQMARCYKMPMEEYLERGLGWYQTSITMNFKRPLVLGDTFVVETGIDFFGASMIQISYRILKKETGKVCADGIAQYALIDLNTKRAVRIPQDVIDRHTI